MEHRLITGGYEYLPFARSCITKLKRLGLPYASQSFEIGGASVKVRIEPGHEYIRIEGGGDLLMDSGVVDMIAIGRLSPDRYKPGIMRMPTHVEEYTSKYYLPTPTKTGEWGGYMIYPSKDESTQIVGSLHISGKIKGMVLPDGSPARSFSPADLPDAEPPYDPVVNEDAVLGKKTIAATLPASVFSGRCRLYIQALYGAPTYMRSGSGNKVPPAWVPYILDTSVGLEPNLLLTSYSRKTDTIEVDGVVQQKIYPKIRVASSSGVYKDSTGRDWLMQFESAGGLYAYPLVASGEAESVRYFLNDENNRLTQEAKRKLETFILSSSLPDTKNKVLVKLVGGVPKVTGMSAGYGWHWSQSGKQAVRTTHSTGEYMYEAYMLSTTVLLDVVEVLDEPDNPANKAFTLSVKYTVVEEDKKWGVRRSEVCITFPDMIHGVSTKLTPFMGQFVPGSAIVYSYFLGEKLIKCGVSVTEVQPYTMREMSANYMETDVAGELGVMPHLTHGLNGGYVRDHTISGHYKVAVTIGEHTSNLVCNMGDLIIEHRTKDKQILDWRDSGGPWNGDAQVYTSDFWINAGRQNVAPPPLFLDIGQPWYDTLPHMQMTIDDANIVRNVADRIIIAVASYDSECVYLYDAPFTVDQTNTRSETGEFYGSYGAGARGSGANYQWYMWSNLPYGFNQQTVVVTSTSETKETTDPVCRIFGHGGNHNAHFDTDAASRVFSPAVDEDVSEIFRSISGFCIPGDTNQKPVTITSWAPGVAAATPFSDSFTDAEVREMDLPAIVGWV